MSISKRYLVITFFICFIANQIFSQSNRYWDFNFNDQSKLLGGAVVSGDSSQSMILFNPAAISLTANSKLYFNSNLAVWTIYNVQNAFGSELDLNTNYLTFAPRAISFQISPKGTNKIYMQFSGYSMQNYSVFYNTTYSQQYDILTNVPGDENYLLNYQYNNRFSEYWIGAGFSYKISERFSLGVSIFGTSIYQNYLKYINFSAYTDSDTAQSSLYIPEYLYNQRLQYDNYGIVTKFGLLYHLDRYSFGLTVRFPGINVFSSFSKNSVHESFSQIVDPETFEPIQDKLLFDFQEINTMNIRVKQPMSIAFGLGVKKIGDRLDLSFAAEYFFGIDPYLMIDATARRGVSTSESYAASPVKDFLSVPQGANPILNVALGAKYKMSDKIFLTAGINTNSNYGIDYDYGQYSDYTPLENYNSGLLTLSAGMIASYKIGQIFTGFQFGYGRSNPQMQSTDFNVNPVQYNSVNDLAIQGTPMETMQVRQILLGLFLGFSLNFLNSAQ